MSHKNGQTIECKQCGIAFYVKLSVINRPGRAQYCSKTCRLIGTKAAPLVDRLKYVIVESGCWIWQKRVDKDGYGIISIKKPKETTLRAHIVSYEIFKCPVPKGLVLDHLCRNPPCINPDHLEPVTNRINILRGVAPPALNVLKTHCPQGHPYAGANLYVNPRHQRICRACMKEAKHRYLERKRAA